MCKQHTTPCKQCPWRRDNQMPGWLGASTAGEFLQQLDSGARMPCHVTVDYENPNWRKQAAVAPECAGAAIHRANRAMSASNRLRLPADHNAVFSRPHEFVSHHIKVDPAALESTVIFELYKK